MNFSCECPRCSGAVDVKNLLSPFVCNFCSEEFIPIQIIKKNRSEKEELQMDKLLLESASKRDKEYEKKLEARLKRDEDIRWIDEHQLRLF